MKYRKGAHGKNEGYEEPHNLLKKKKKAASDQLNILKYACEDKFTMINDKNNKTCEHISATNVWFLWSISDEEKVFLKDMCTDGAKSDRQNMVPWNVIAPTSLSTINQEENHKAISL